MSFAAMVLNVYFSYYFDMRKDPPKVNDMVVHTLQDHGHWEVRFWSRERRQKVQLTRRCRVCGAEAEFSCYMSVNRTLYYIRAGLIPVHEDR